MADAVRKSVRSFLRINPPRQSVFQITEQLDYYGNAAVNRIWARADADEISQLYKLLPGDVNRTRFWAAVPTVGNDINKLHTGLPKLMRKTITDIVIADMNDIRVEDEKYKEVWKNIVKDNKLEKLVEEAVKEVLVVGDGAFKISLDPSITQYPIVEFFPGDRLEYVYSRKRLKEIIFRTVYQKKNNAYVLEETYGLGYIRSKLLLNDREVPLNSIDETKELVPEVTFDKFMMAKQFMVFESDKYAGRGDSIFDGKKDSFDSLDEAWSQWMDALRRGRSREYIPENMLPKNPDTGEVLAPAAFDNAYIKVAAPMQEGRTDEIEIKQPSIPHESYLSTYMTALDLCLQGVLSPSTLGIDVKKLDNADAQREKEKATLYTRNKIVRALQETIPDLADILIKANNSLNQAPLEDVTAEVPFGEYANPSFESQVETVSKGKTGGIMSTEACVEELYGDSKTEEWKEEEVARIKAEQGIVELEEPSLSTEAGGFRVKGFADESQSSE